MHARRKTLAKILLVEDDDNLRGIYGDRLGAEGYQILSAKDGEEALALAVKEKPDLIISDIMMPKISGFDMLDILRSTPETKDTKVIMMTALSQKEDQERGQKLGANRYLVKSQVTLEDVVRVTAEVLAENKPSDIGYSAVVAPPMPSSVPDAPPPVAVTPPPVVPPVEPPVIPTPIDTPAPEPEVVAPLPEPVPAPAPATAGESTIANAAVGGQRVIQPLDQTIGAPKPDINQLYQEEMAKDLPFSPPPAEEPVNKITPPSDTPPTPGSNPSDIAL